MVSTALCCRLYCSSDGVNPLCAVGCAALLIVLTRFVLQAVQQCCKTLQERMAPIKAKYPDADWPTLCRKALDAKVDLGARYT